MAQASKGIIPKDVGGPFGQRIGVTIGGNLASALTVGAYVTGRVNPSDWLRYSIVVLNENDGVSTGGSWNPVAVPTTIEFRGMQVCSNRFFRLKPDSSFLGVIYVPGRSHDFMVVRTRNLTQRNTGRRLLHFIRGIRWQTATPSLHEMKAKFTRMAKKSIQHSFFGASVVLTGRKTST
ncbi:hypothetical protein EV361DRAFT_356983 [Lentinula raphanica]|nr:hypothetical protein EV361DRAFT_356983 [Lentinula raphanica]